MRYDDEPILSIDEYEVMAKAYSASLKKKGFVIVHIDNEKNRELIYQTFDCLYKIKSCLFMLGGFLNTSKLYSMNERQMKKLAVIFDYNEPPIQYRVPTDKTLCFLEFVGLESLLIKNLIELSEQSNFELEIKEIINYRLNTTNKLFNLKI